LRTLQSKHEDLNNPPPSSGTPRQPTSLQGRVDLIPYFEEGAGLNAEATRQPPGDLIPYFEWGKSATETNAHNGAVITTCGGGGVPVRMGRTRTCSEPLGEAARGLRGLAVPGLRGQERPAGGPGACGRTDDQRGEGGKELQGWARLYWWRSWWVGCVDEHGTYQRPLLPLMHQGSPRCRWASSFAPGPLLASRSLSFAPALPPRLFPQVQGRGIHPPPMLSLRGPTARQLAAVH